MATAKKPIHFPNFENGDETIEFRIKNGTVCGILGVCDHKEPHSNYKSGGNAPSSC
jgi:hypothetical protein